MSNSNFLADYREFCRELEVPQSFNVFASLVALGALTERKVWCMKGDYIRIYPNLYVVLVGPPGCGKNVAMEIVEDLLHHFKLPVSAESVTREKLIMDIQACEQTLDWLLKDTRYPEAERKKYSQVSPYTILATELSEFLGAGGIGMISFLTDIYSRNIYEYRTKNKGSVFVRGPHLSLIGGTTPDWVTTYLKDDIISGGFSRRCLFLYATGREGSNPRPKIKPEMRAAWERVLSRGAAIRQLRGEFRWDPEAEKFFDAWYPHRRASSDPSVIGYYETKDIFLIKVAMLVAMSTSDELVLRKEHFIAALELLGIAELNLVKVFQGIGQNELNLATLKVISHLETAKTRKVKLHDGHEEDLKCMPEKILRSLMWKDCNEMQMNMVLTHLIAADRITKAAFTENDTQRVYIILKR